MALASRPFSWRRKLSRASVGWFAFSGISAGAAFLLVQGQAARLDAMSPPASVAVVVAARRLEAGATLTPADLAVADSLDAPPGAIGAVAQAVGRTLVAPIAPGEPLTVTRLADSALAGLVPPGHLVVQLAAAGAPEGLAVGDHVDVLATFAGARPYTSVVGSDLRVVRVVPGETGLDGATSIAVALDVDETTARAVLGAAASAVIGLAVHGPAFVPDPSPSAAPSPLIEGGIAGG